MNHFIYKNFYTSNNFKHITKELIKLNQQIKSKNHIILYEKRAYERAFFIKTFFHIHLSKDKYIPIYIDLFNTVDIFDFIKKYYIQIASSLIYEYSIILKTLKTLFSKVNFVAMMQNDGTLKFDITLLSYNIDELLADIYKGLDKIYVEKNKTIVIAIDQFWQLNNLKEKNIEQLLRQYITQKSYITYIFTGDKYRQIFDIFLDEKRPLYNTAKTFELTAIPLDELYKYFSNMCTNLDFDVFTMVYNLCDAEIRLIYKALYYCYEISNYETITLADIDDIENFLLYDLDEYFKILFNRFTPVQKTALKSIILSDGIELYTKVNLFKLQITKASLNTAIKYLYQEEFIDKKENKYYICNRSFELWCKKNLMY